MKIKLAKKESDYILEKVLQKENSNFIEAVKNRELSEDEANDIRDICLEKLDTIGYDENYELNDDGVILNELIDKLYIG